MNSAIINVRTQRHCMRLRRILEAGTGKEASGFDRDSTSGNGWAFAIGAGSVPTDEPRAHVMKMQREGCRRSVCSVVQGTGYPNTGSCAPTHHRSGMNQDVWTIHTSDHGLPMTPLRLHTASGAGKEKDQCANTGLLRKESWIVRFGIRSDRFVNA
jgi:hypothetical protein